MPRRRWIIRWLIAPLLLGAVTTVAVTWGIAAWLPQRNWAATFTAIDGEAEGPFFLTITEYRTPGAARRHWRRQRERTFSFSDPYLGAILNLPPYPYTRTIDKPRHMPEWGRVEALRVDAASQPADGMEHATGWPSLAAWYAVSTYTPPGTQGFKYAIHGGITVDNSDIWPIFGRSLSTLRALPYRPIWPGIIINTLFYTALWLVPLAGVRTARRAWRRHRHRCPACAYRLAGLSPRDGMLTCPECGHPQRTPAPTVITPPREAASTLPPATGGKAGTTEKA